MSFASVLISAEKGIEVGIADALKIFGAVEAKTPSAVTALTALAGAVETALAAAAADTNVSTLVITLPTTVADFKNVWEDGKAFLASLGIK
jgi:NCAIR mutase (PurE)-related protein